MKKHRFLLVFLLLALLTICLCACNKNETTISQNRYKVANAISYVSDTGEESFKEVYSATIGDNNFYVFLLGQVDYVPIVTNTPIAYTGTPITISFSKDSVTEESISQANTKTVTESVNFGTSMSSSVEVSTSVSASIDVDFISTEVSNGIKSSIETTLSNNVGKEISTANTYETAMKKAESLTESITYTIGNNGEKYGKYRYGLFASTVIYYIAKLNIDNSEVIKTSISICADPNTYYYAIDFDENLSGNFNKTFDTDSLATPSENYLKRLTLPKNKFSSDTVQDNQKPVNYKPIANIQDFRDMAFNSGGKYILTSDLNLGSWDSPFEFSGQFNGGGHTIKFSQNLSAEKDKETFFGGLFSVLNGAIVENLNLEVEIERNKDYKWSKGYVGALAAQAKGNNKIHQISVSPYGFINIIDSSGSNYCGGIIGMFEGGEISQCANMARVFDEGQRARTGGIVGYACPNYSPITIMNCYNIGNLKSSSWFVGGPAGNALRSSGGIVGQAKGHNNNSLKVENCYNDSEVKLEWNGRSGGDWGRGGILGDIEGAKKDNLIVKNCWWNNLKSKCELGGNSYDLQVSFGTEKMYGTFYDWDRSVWIISENSAPKLKWMTNY